MSDAIKCDGGCGRQTRNPYRIKGAYFCVDCAEERAPGLVRDRLRRDWRNWNGGRDVYPYKTRTD